MTQLELLLTDLSRADAWVELLALAACLVAAYAACRWWGRRAVPESVWFGRRTIDGLLFPLVAWGLTYGVKLLWFADPKFVVFQLAAPILLALAAIRLIARVLSRAYPNSGLTKVVERVFSWVMWVGVVLWLVGALPAVLAEMDAIQFAFGKGKTSLRTLIEGFLSAGLVMILALWVSAAIEAQVLREAVADLSLRKITGGIIRGVLLLLGLIFALSAVGVDLTALSVLGGGLGVGLGLGLQRLASNYVSGIVILLERSLQIGDKVRLDNFEGTISDIKTRYTIIHALNGREAIVPNEKLINERVENLSSADTTTQVTSEIRVSSASDVEQVRSILRDAALTVRRVMSKPEPEVYLTSLGRDGLSFTLGFFINDPDDGQMNVKSEVNFAVWRALREAGVELAPAEGRFV
jgi:small-conductance mechanosensitive channel